MSRSTRTIAVTLAAVAAAVLQPAAPASAYWACGAPRPPQLDKSPIVESVVDFSVRRGSSDGCGIVAEIPNGPYLDFYCYTLGPDGDRWTYVYDFYYNRGPGWVRNTFLPNNGSKVFCGK